MAKGKIAQDTNICYAAAAGQLLDANRFSHGDSRLEHITAPLHLSALSSDIHKKEGPRTLALGSPAQALSAGLTYGSCNENKLQISSTEMKEILDLFQQFTRYDEKIHQNERAEIELSLFCQLSPKVSQDLNLFLNQLQGALREIDEPLFMRKLTEKMCSTNVILFQPNSIQIVTKRAGPLTTSEKIQLLNTAFIDEPIQPVALAFWMRALRTDVQGLHASVVAGQRIQGGRCQILIRDSYGKDSCKRKKYRPELECLDGQIWVDREELLKDTSFFDWLSNQNESSGQSR